MPIDRFSSLPWQTVRLTWDYSGLDNVVNGAYSANRQQDAETSGGRDGDSAGCPANRREGVTRERLKLALTEDYGSLSW